MGAIAAFARRPRDVHVDTSRCARASASLLALKCRVRRESIEASSCELAHDAGRALARLARRSSAPPRHLFSRAAQSDLPVLTWHRLAIHIITTLTADHARNARIGAASLTIEPGVQLRTVTDAALTCRLRPPRFLAPFSPQRLSRPASRSGHHGQHCNPLAARLPACPDVLIVAPGILFACSLAVLGAAAPWRAAIRIIAGIYQTEQQTD